MKYRTSTFRSFLIPLLVLALLLSGCSKDKAEQPTAGSGFASSVYINEFPSNRISSDGFDHAAFDAAMISAALGTASVTGENGQITVDTENHVISPANLYFTTASLAYLTGSTTRFQLLKVLGLSKINEAQKIVETLWNSQFYRTSDAVSLLGSALFINSSLKVPQDKLNELSDQYYTASYAGRPGTSSFNETYRSWLSSMSGGLLDEAITEAELPGDLAVAAATTLFYKAFFSESFKTDSTHRETFYTPTTDVTVYMMYREGSFPYHQDVTFQAAGIPLMNGSTLWLLLPAEGQTPASLCSDPAVLAWMSDASNDEATLSLAVPRFDITQQTDFIPCLKSAGVTEIFDASKADFSGLSGELSGCSVSQWDQTVRIQLFEGGIEAAAFGDTQATSSAASRDAIQFRLNKPFVFLLRDFDGTILFVGTVNDPSK